MEKVYRSPISKKAWYITVFLALGAALLPIIFPIGVFSVVGLFAPLLILLAQSYNRYTLKSTGLEVKQFLQKSKLIPYASIYKIKKQENPKFTSFLHGGRLFAVEVYYDKFELQPVLTDKHEEFIKALNQKMAASAVNAAAHASNKSA